MASEKFDAGLALRREVLGDDYVTRAMANADEFSQPLQELVTEFAWGTVWQREGLPRRDRSLMTVVMLVALNRPHELRLHLRGALNNGLSREELREATTAWAAKLAKQGRLGNWLTKQSVNHVEELRGKRSAMDAVFHMHHFAHAQNDLVKGDSIAGVSGKSAASANKKSA